MKNTRTVNLSMEIGETSNVEVYEDDPTQPAALEDLAEFPKIQAMVDTEWGTVRLKEYLEKLMADTRNNSRAGFPREFGDALIRLVMANDRALEKKGISTADDYVSQFAVTGWELPKNF